jgi:hypothetical protein
LPLRMPRIRHPDEKDKIPGEGKSTWLRRRMGIPVDMQLKDQNKAATTFYNRVKFLSQQELDRPFTWYTTKGLSQKMIERVVTGMASHDWNERLARDVLINICQRRCQNIGKRKNDERRQAGQEIKLGRPKTIRLTDSENPMDFVSAMNAVTEDPSVTTYVTKPTPEPQHLLEIVGSAKQYRAKLGLISSTQTDPGNSGKRRKLKEPESEPQSQYDSSFANASVPVLSDHLPRLLSSARPHPIQSKSHLAPIPFTSRIPPTPSSSRLSPIRFTSRLSASPSSYARSVSGRPISTVNSNRTIASTSQVRSPYLSLLS